MKLRIYTKKETVLQQLLEEKGDLEDLLADTETALGEQVIILDPSKESRLKSNAVVYQNRLKELMTQVTLIESHGAPEVLLELDI